MDTAVTVVQRARTDPASVVLEGFHAVKHALRFGADVTPVLTRDRDALLDLAARLAPDLHDRLAADVVEVGEAEWAAAGAGSLPSPAIGVARRPGPRPWPSGAGPGVLLEDPRHLGNLGACVRVAAAAGAVGVLTTGTADPWHPSAVRAAAGLHFAVQVGQVADPAVLTAPLVAVDPGGSPLGSVTVPPHAIYVFGTERHGLTPPMRSLAVAAVSIPMREGVSSLNLATAVAVVLYHDRGVLR